MPWNPAQLKTLREQRGLSQVALAERAGTHPISVAKWETGGRTPSIDLLEKLAKALRVPVTDLLTRRRPASKPPAKK
jgi:transcriptional regulator with XRE-family HTH domain